MSENMQVGTGFEAVIRMDMVESGSTITACKLLGIVPETHEAGDFNLYVRTQGSVVRVDRSDTDETLVKAVGFEAAMVALADYYGLPVVVAMDYGVKQTAKSKTLIGKYEPTQVHTTAHLVTGQTVAVGDLITVEEGETGANLGGIIPTWEILSIQARRMVVRDMVTGLRSVHGGGYVGSPEGSDFRYFHGHIVTRAPKCPDCGDTVAYVPGACVNCGHTTEPVEVQADQAQATTDGRPVLGTKVVTDRDMREQVTTVLGSDVADFDVPWIVDRIQVEFGTVDISTVPAQRFWDIVHVHGSRDLIEGRRAVVRQMVLAYLGAQSLSAEHVNMDAVVRDLTAPGRVLPGELTPGDIADALIMDAFSLPLVEREIWAGTDTLVKPRFRALLGRRKRKASKVNARRVRGGF